MTAKTVMPATPDTRAVVIGRDAGMFGRVFRLVTGLLAVVAGGANLAGHASTTAVVQTLAWFVCLAVFYLLLHRLVAHRISERVDPFVATVIVLGPLGIFSLSVFPSALHSAVGLYVGASLVLTALMGYGGCEVIALPNLLSRRRTVVYCPINLVDAAERPLHRTGNRLGRAAALLGLVVAGWYLVAAPVLGRFGVSVPVSDRWALLLLLPALVLGVRAWQARAVRATAFGYALGSAALLAGAAVLTGLVSQESVFAAAVLAGLVLAAVRLVRHATRARAER